MGGPFYFFFFVLLCKYRKVAHLEQQCFYERGFPDFNSPPRSCHGPAIGASYVRHGTGRHVLNFLIY